MHKNSFKVTLIIMKGCVKMRKSVINLSVKEAKKVMLLAISLGVFGIIFGWWFKVFQSPHLTGRGPMYTFLAIMPYLLWVAGSWLIIIGIVYYIVIKRKHRSAKS